MYSTPSKDAEPGAYPVPMTQGLFIDGVWHCNCKPRRPTSHLQVRKDCPNKGRWFYTCRKPKEVGCSFFLWESAATSRESGTVLSNSRSESVPVESVASYADRRDRGTVEDNLEAGDTWTDDVKPKEEEEFGERSLLVKDKILALGAVLANETPCPETPRKPVIFGTNTTSGIKRRRSEDELPTPITSNKRLFTSHRSHMFLNSGDGLSLKFAPPSPSATLTPDRFHKGHETNDLALYSDDYDITEEVMDILKNEALPDDIATRLRHTLNRHALKDQGVARGRDITRVALKSKDAKNAELQKRIVELEAECDRYRDIIRRFKNDIAESVSGRGRGGIRGRSRGSSVGGGG